jgi:cysteine protease ATG4
MRYILDSDAQPDKCTDPIWVVGILHQGYEPPSVTTQPSPSTPPPPTRRDCTDSRRSPSSRRSSSSSSYSNSTLSTSPSTSSSKPSSSWPPAFYSDYTSRIWLTYRSHYPPIRDTALASLDTDTDTRDLNSSQIRRWNWPGTGEKTWTSDAGWGCMLRTGQSILANSLIHLHLARGKLNMYGFHRKIV